MIVLDTNVLSELMRNEPDAQVLAWLDDQYAVEFHTTSITVAELFYGIARLPAGRKKSDLREAANALLEGPLAGRVLPFDEAAARHYAVIVCERSALGRPIESADAQIAAVCSGHDAILVTRNVKDFEGVGLTIVDPWQPESR